MIRSGDVIENPITGEKVLFHKTSADTNGEYCDIEVWVQPDGAVAAAHIHPTQTETFEVLDGSVGFKRGREKLVAEAGDTVVVEPGTAHKFWNAGEGVAHFRCEVRPAGQFEQLLETMYGLAADGKTNKKGMPNPLRLAVIANHHFAELRLPVIPAVMQKIGLAMGAPLGKLAGYTPHYEPTAGEAVAAQA